MMCLFYRLKAFFYRIKANDLFTLRKYFSSFSIFNHENISFFILKKIYIRNIENNFLLFLVFFIRFTNF